MKQHRHPHPHIDPRQPRDKTRVGTNPPVFAWKPVDSEEGFRLRVARDEAFADLCVDVEGLEDPVYLPEKAFAPGRYYWNWSVWKSRLEAAPTIGCGGRAESEVFEFEITPQAAVVEVPAAAEWLARFPTGHPRTYVRPEEVAALRESREGERAELWEELRAAAEGLLEEPQELDEPPFLPDWSRDYQAAFRTWLPILWDSRRFVQGAQTLALAHLASGEERYARAACQRMASVSRWDPEGSSHISHNDEAHMSVIWHGSQACDWVWDQFTDEERALVIEQFRRRGQITYEHMHDQGSYGVSRFDSHSGREVVFLALIAMVFHEQIPEAETWLEWLRPVLCGIWPVWAGDDGAWAEGPSYGLAYVDIMTMFATALKRGAGVDLYKRPFWKGHAGWRQWCLPPYAEWMGFGDHSERWQGTWLRNAELVDLIDRETEAGAFGGYVSSFRREAASLETRGERGAEVVGAQQYLAAPCEAEGEGAAVSGDVLRVFPGAGWAAIRANLSEAAEDIALIFRSSPYGAISHSHASNNDFIIHVGGKVMAMPSGYYDGYGSDHHTHWVWHTKSHNCVTLSGAPQIMRSHDSRGAVENAFEDERLAYFRGNADASYRDRATRCRRHVVFLKAHRCFVMIDEFIAAPGVVSAFEWNMHSWNPFEVSDEERKFVLERDGSALEGHFMYHLNAFTSLSEGWDPPPESAKSNDQWYQQHHLRFTTTGLVGQRNLGVVLCPGHASLEPAKVTTQRANGTEVARIGDDLALVSQGGAIEYEGLRSEGLAMLVVGGQRYEIGDEGIRVW